MEKNNYWSNRKTIRSFSEKQIDDSIIYKYLKEASHAPTTSNMQLYSVIITRDPEMKAKLTPAHFNQPASTNAPILLTFRADFNRFCKWCDASNAEPGYNNFQSFIAAVLDTTILAQQFNTIAEMNGLGCCYLGTTTYNAQHIADILRLPDMVVPIITLAVGYPNEEGSVSDRLPIDAIVHKETYKELPSSDVRNRFYKLKEELCESKHFVEQNNKESLAQVFTDVRYPKSNNEHFSKLFYEFIEKSGYQWPND